MGMMQVKGRVQGDRVYELVLQGAFFEGQRHRWCSPRPLVFHPAEAQSREQSRAEQRHRGRFKQRHRGRFKRGTEAESREQSRAEAQRQVQGDGLTVVQVSTAGECSVPWAQNRTFPKPFWRDSRDRSLP